MHEPFENEELNQELIEEKERLISLFFDIGGNDNVEALDECKLQCQKFIEIKNDEDISDLICVIDGVKCLFETDSKEKSSSYVIDLWYKLQSKLIGSFSFFEIRILNCIFFVQSDIEGMVELVEECLAQLDEDYKNNDYYLRVKVTMKLNLLHFLMDAKFFDKNYDNKFDGLIIETIEDIVTLNLKNKLDNNYYVAIATMYKGILLKDQNQIYIGSLLLRNCSQINKKQIQKIIKFYADKYDITI